MNERVYDVVILGSGPAGLTAAIYAQRFGLSTIVVAGRKWGGQLMLTTDVENYPGFPTILGPDLMKRMRDHVTGLGVEVIDRDVTRLDTKTHPFTVTAEDASYVGKTVIVATGADTRWLNVPGEERLRGRGVSSCAPCDAFFFKGKKVAVVGGGDSAMEEAHVLAKVSPDVIIIHRRDEFRAQKAMIDKVRKLANIRFLFNTDIVEMLGDQVLTGILLRTVKISPNQGVTTVAELAKSFGGILRPDQVKLQGALWELPRNGLFIAVGLIPNTQVFGSLEQDSHGYVKRFEEHDGNGVLVYFTKTSVPGIFTAGDVHDARYKQAVTAAGFGCMAALDVQRWLSEQS
jgi:thioredoxin reductase (NADPH)